MQNPKIRPREWDAQNTQEFWDTNGSPNYDQKTRANDNKQKAIKQNNKQKKKEACYIVDFTVPADHRVTIKESKKIFTKVDLARELKRCGT